MVVTPEELRKMFAEYSSEVSRALRQPTPEQFERDNALAAVHVPTSLTAPAGAKPYEQKAHESAEELYRHIVVSGAEGIELRKLGLWIGKERRAAAVKLLRKAGVLDESTEQRDQSARKVIVFRPASDRNAPQKTMSAADSEPLDGGDIIADKIKAVVRSDDGYRTCRECVSDCVPEDISTDDTGTRIAFVCPEHGLHSVVDPFEHLR